MDLTSNLYISTHAVGVMRFALAPDSLRVSRVSKLAQVEYHRKWSILTN